MSVSGILTTPSTESNAQKQRDMKISQNLSSWDGLVMRMQMLPALSCSHNAISQYSQETCSFISPSGAATTVSSLCTFSPAICPSWMSASPPWWPPNWWQNYWPSGGPSPTMTVWPRIFMPISLAPLRS